MLIDVSIRSPGNRDYCAVKTHVFRKLEYAGLLREKRDFLYSINPIDTDSVIIRSKNILLMRLGEHRAVPAPKARDMYRFCLRASPMTRQSLDEPWTEVATDDLAEWSSETFWFHGAYVREQFCKPNSAYCGRADGSFTLPDVVFVGELVVIDPSRLIRALELGIGRHKTYGFGLLQLISN